MELFARNISYLSCRLDPLDDDDLLLLNQLRQEVLQYWDNGSLSH